MGTEPAELLDMELSEVYDFIQREFSQASRVKVSNSMLVFLM